MEVGSAIKHEYGRQLSVIKGGDSCYCLTFRGLAYTVEYILAYSIRARFQPHLITYCTIMNSIQDKF